MLFTSPPQEKLLQWRWPNFSPTELSCKCSGQFCDGEYWHDVAFLDHLQGLRDDMQRALDVTSGHRCLRWNIAVGGAQHSQHLRIAVDIRLQGHDHVSLLEKADKRGFTGIGLAKTFIHLDRRANPARWYYRGAEPLWRR